MNKNERIYYPCLSYKQMHFLMSKGLKPLLQCRHYDTGNPMWIFMYEENRKLLDNALQEWSDGEPS